MEQTVILVDENDKFLGYAPKKDCHTGNGKKHRAFVTLLFDRQSQVILQKRRHALFDNLWDFTTVSHPLHLPGSDEDYQVASNRALAKELEIGPVSVKKIGGFNYFEKDGENCENEYCAILIGNYDGEHSPNKDEVYEVKKIGFEDFVKDIKKNPQKYTPWARLAVNQLKNL